MRILKTLVPAALLAVAGMASAATTVNITYQGTQGVETTSTGTFDYVTGAMSYTTTSGTSFLAYCIELAQGYAPSALGAQTYTVSTYSGANADLLQNLFSSSYAGLSTDVQKAAFQTAVWELTHEASSTLSASSGSFSFDFLTATSTAEEDAAFLALTNSYLSAALSYTGTAKYTLSQLSNGSYQDLITVSAVPEPQTYAMLLAGLGTVGFLARRRRRV